MPKIADVKTSPSFSLMDGLLIGVSKIATEKALSMTPVGNATLRSGFLKLVGAGLLWGVTKNQSGFIKKGGSIVSTAMTIDGMEDIATIGFKRLGLSEKLGTSPEARTI